LFVFIFLILHQGLLSIEVCAGWTGAIGETITGVTNQLSLIATETLFGTEHIKQLLW